MCIVTKIFCFIFKTLHFLIKYNIYTTFKKIQEKPLPKFSWIVDFKNSASLTAIGAKDNNNLRII